MARTRIEQTAIEISRRSGWQIPPGLYDLIVEELEASTAPYKELIDLCIGILECLEQGDTWKAPARQHAAKLLRERLEELEAIQPQQKG